MCDTGVTLAAVDVNIDDIEIICDTCTAGKFKVTADQCYGMYGPICVSGQISHIKPYC